MKQNGQRLNADLAPVVVPGFLGWRMVVLGFIAVNLAIGFTFGTFGVLIKPVAAELHASRGLASFAIALIVLLIGFAGPVLGIALRRFSIRAIMSTGALLMMLGFALASKATYFGVFLLGYSVLGGMGCAMLSIIPVSTLITNWYVSRRGFALGLINVPLLVAIAPPLFAWLVELHDWRFALACQAALLLLILPLLRLIIDRPEDVGQQALGALRADASAEPAVVATAQVWGNAQLLRSGYYLGLVVSIALMSCGGIVIVSHIVPFATDHGIAATSAAILLTINGISAMVGALLFGWIADRLGARLTLGFIGVAQTVLWVALLALPQFGAIALLLIGIGMCAGGLLPAFCALLGSTYGAEAFGAALGLSLLLMLPFTFFAAPVAGSIFDAYGSYTNAFLVQIACFALAAVMLLVFYRRQPR